MSPLNGQYLKLNALIILLHHLHVHALQVHFTHLRDECSGHSGHGDWRWEMSGVGA